MLGRGLAGEAQDGRVSGRRDGLDFGAQMSRVGWQVALEHRSGIGSLDRSEPLAQVVGQERCRGGHSACTILMTLLCVAVRAHVLLIRRFLHWWAAVGWNDLIKLYCPILPRAGGYQRRPLAARIVGEELSLPVAIVRADPTRSSWPPGGQVSATEFAELAEDPHAVGVRAGGNGAARRAEGDRFAELLDCLMRWGGAGRRARGFLESARWLLGADAPASVRRGEAAAYCVREAADSILKSAGTVSDDSRWGEPIDCVVDADDRSEQARGVTGGGGSEAAFAEVLGEIDATDEFERNPATLNEIRAAEVVARLTGSPAQQGDLAPVVEFLRARERANNFLHSRCSVEDAERLLEECAEAMLGVVRTPADRSSELAEVAGRASPSDADLAEARRLIVTDRDLEVFLDGVRDPVWLVLLSRDGRLNPPGEDGRWVAHRAAVRLSTSHRQQVTDWLVAVADQRPRDSGWNAAAVGALLNMEDPDIALALRFAKRHYDSGQMLWSFRHALEDIDPSEAVVSRCADVFLNNLAAREDQTGRGAEPGWNHMPWDLMDLLKMVADGAEEANADDRIEMLLHKMRRMPLRHGHFGLFPIGRERQLPVSALMEIDLDDDSAYDADPLHAVGGCLVRIMEQAMAWLPAAELLDLAEIAPEELAGRLRTWILAAAGDADPDAMAAEIARAIGSRRPHGDDIALIDRIAQDADPRAYSDRWRAALGDPPTAAEARQALESREPLPERWRFPYFWTSLLPEPAAAAWDGAPGPGVLADVIGPPEGRDYFIGLQDSPDDGVEACWISAPLSAADLRGLDPQRTAAEIAAWRPQPHGWPHSYRMIADELEKLVVEDPAGWLADPTTIAETLYHPTYIAGYLRAAARAAAENPAAFDAATVGGLVDMMGAVQAEPWPAEMFGGDSRPGIDYDADWTAARREGSDLAKTLIEKGIGLAGRDDHVWEYLDAEARTNPNIYDADLHGPGFSDDPVGHMLENAEERNTTAEPLHMAINQANTWALNAAVSFMSAEHHATQGVRAEAADLLGWCLRQPGLEGAKHRAIIAPHAARLSVIMADWFEQNHSLLFGADAPGRLGQLAVDMAVKWSSPWKWLVINYRDEVFDAAARGVERSLDWVLEAMLHKTDGYSPRRLAQELDGRIPQACTAMSGLIDHAQRTPDQMEAFGDFCDAVIEHRGGRHAVALGRLAHARSLDHDNWAAITLKALDKTGGRISSSHAIVKRIFDNPPTPQCAAILNWLVVVQTNEARPQAASRRSGRTDSTWPRMLIADGAAAWLETAQGREPGDKYSQLEDTLIDHGLLGPTGLPESR